MIDRFAHYKSLKGTNEEKILTFKFVDKNDDKQKIKVSCLNKKYFNKKEHKDDIVGYVHLKNKKKYSNKEYATLNGVEGYSDPVDIYSKKRIYEGIVGYIETTDNEYLAVVRNYLLIIILFGLCILGLLLGLLLIPNNKKLEPIDPNSSVVVDDSACVLDEPDLYVEVILPDGEVNFDGTISTLEDERIKQDDKEHKGEVYNGDGSIKVTMIVNGVEKTLIDTTKIQVINGELPDIYIDFTKLDFELTPGIYDGYVYITYPDGTTIKKPIQIVIVSSTSGTIGINYSDKVNINLNDSSITLKYVPFNAPTKSWIQIVLINDEVEYILSESGYIENGQAIKSLELKDDMKSILSEGTYRGIMRVYVDQGTTDESITGLHTDIEVTISVQ